MTREELRVFLWKHFCGCGNPEAAAGALLNLLEIWDDRRPDGRAMYQELPKLVQDNGCMWLLIYLIDQHMGVIEHGGGALASWTTALGSDVLEALQREKEDGFAALMSPACAHGYDLSDHSHDCMAADRIQGIADKGQ